MSVSLRKEFNIDGWLHEYTRQKKLALCMWYKIIVSLQHEDKVDICNEKMVFALEHSIIWKSNCFLCNLFLHSKSIEDCCTICPLEKKKGGSQHGCSLDDKTPWARVINEYLPREDRIAAAWEIVEAIKSV